MKDFAKTLGGIITAEAFDLILRTFKLDVSFEGYKDAEDSLIFGELTESRFTFYMYLLFNNGSLID
jgi:hypothetical protein